MLSQASAKDNYKAQKRINIRRIKMLEKLATSTSVVSRQLPVYSVKLFQESH